MQDLSLRHSAKGKPMHPFSAQETKLLLKGPAGDIEAITTTASEEKKISATVIICHPHPLHGGTMNNKVISTLARTFHDMGLHTVRFNFRGVGKSSGIHDEGNGETDDVLAIATWIKTQRPTDALWLAGFSFGGFVAASAATKLDVAELITIAPQVSRFLTAKLPPIICPWLIVQGGQDDIVSPQELYAWVETLEPKPKLIRLPNAGHFFHGQLLELRKILEEMFA